MRVKILTSLTLLAAAALPASMTTACGRHSDCNDLRTCGGPGGDGGDSGSGGSGGDSGYGGSAGKGGASGKGGTGGTAGKGGAGGEGGTAAAGGSSGDAGSSGNAGAAGSGGAGGASGDGGSAGAAGSAGSGGDGGIPCDAESDPFEDACVISEEYGVFVSPTGNDTAGDGSRTKPYKTFARGLVEADVSNKRLYACATSGDYAEQLHIDATLDGVRVLGALDCADWHADVALKASVHPASGPALLIENLTQGATLQNLAFESSDATSAGGSSIAAIVNESVDVKFKTVSVKAGKGAAGTDGTLEPFTLTGKAPKGNDAVENAAGATKVCECPGGDSSTGAKGGEGGDAVSDGENGAPNLGAGEGGTGITEQNEGTVSCGNGATGDDGANAAAPADATGASTHGALSGTSWAPSNGTNGSHGGVGQGGGGGGGHYDTAPDEPGGGGGGGGCGGCGGAGGKGGKGGGASLGLLSVNSTVTLEASSVATSDGGKGGKGATGQLESQTGGTKGNGAEIGCDGGSGGKGAFGAAGGGGAGGISVGILWSGTANQEPSAEGLTSELGQAGLGGDGGGASNAGVAGVQVEKAKANEL